jgi:hypothetical protein
MLSRWKDQKIDALAVVVSASAFLNVVSCWRTGFGLAAFYSGAGISRARGYGVLECSCGIGIGSCDREREILPEKGRWDCEARARELWKTVDASRDRGKSRAGRLLKKRQFCYSKKRQFCNWVSAPLKVNGLQKPMN